MHKLNVISIQRGCVHDGPGIRTTVFLKGCVLNCPWCCNPESISPEPETFIDNEKCLIQKGIDSSLCNNCVRKGGSKTIEECIIGVSTPVSRIIACEDIYKIIVKDRSLFTISNGGVTFSGGEPLLQAHKLIPLLKDLEKENIRTCLETSLMASQDTIKLIRPYVEHYIVDLKLHPVMGMLKSTNYMETLKNNIDIIKDKKNCIEYRLVYNDGMESRIKDILIFVKELGIKNIGLIKCHDLATQKYIKLGKKDQMFKAKVNGFDEFVHTMTTLGLEINELKI